MPLYNTGDHTNDYAQRRKEDQRREAIVNEFLDSKVYPKMGIHPNRNTEKDTQLKGIDITFKLDGREYLCDEKSAVRNGTSRLNTFCLELSHKPRGFYRNVEGWFLKEDNLTNSYMLVWVDGLKNDQWRNADSIQSAQVLLVRKKSILDWLEKQGITEDRLRTLTGAMLEQGVHEHYLPLKEPYTEEGGRVVDRLKMVQLEYLSENPVNLLLPRSAYMQIADRNRFIIQR